MGAKIHLCGGSCLPSPVRLACNEITRELFAMSDHCFLFRREYRTSPSSNTNLYLHSPRFRLRVSTVAQNVAVFPSASAHSTLIRLPAVGSVVIFLSLGMGKVWVLGVPPRILLMDAHSACELLSYCSIVTRLTNSGTVCRATIGGARATSSGPRTVRFLVNIGFSDHAL
jgi:hypothetical protein